MRKLLILGCIFLFSFIASAITGVFIWHTHTHVAQAAQENSLLSPVVSPQASASATPEPTITSQPVTSTPTAHPTFTPSVTPTKKTNVSDPGLAAALAQKYGSATTRVDKQQGNVAMGSIGGKWWVAVQIDSGWKVVDDGVSYSHCSIMSQYHVPSSIMPVCWDNVRGLVNR